MTLIKNLCTCLCGPSGTEVGDRLHESTINLFTRALKMMAR
jgi:hypothetical protein